MKTQRMEEKKQAEVKDKLLVASPGSGQNAKTEIQVRKSSRIKKLFAKSDEESTVPQKEIGHVNAIYRNGSFNGHLEQARLASGSTRRRGRGYHHYFSTHPWDFSEERISFLQQVCSFGRL